MMRKCLIILMGLLATSVYAETDCDKGAFGECLAPLDPYAAPIRYKSAEQESKERQEESRRWDPVIVNGPDRARMYYPNGDGTFYQTYDR